MALKWEVGRALDEERRDYVHTCLFQLDYFRKLVLRTGLVEKAEQIGWWIGDEVYSGLNPLDAVADHLNRVAAILDLPLYDIWVDDGYAIVEGAMRSPFGGVIVGTPERLVDLDGTEVVSEDEGEIAVNEEDILVTMRGEQRDLDRLARAWPRLERDIIPYLRGRMILCRREPVPPEDEDETLAQRFEREAAEEEPEKPHLCVLLVNSLFEQHTIYDTLFEVLVRAWEEERDAEDRRRKARFRVGRRRRIARRSRGIGRANRPTPGARKAARLGDNGRAGRHAPPNSRAR